MEEEFDEQGQRGAEDSAAAAARQAKRERERDRLLADIASRVTNDLKQQVGYVLNHYPVCRDSDVTLALQVWKTFSEGDIEGDYIRLKALYDLARYNDIVRHRQKIQNEYGLFQARPEIEEYRKTRRSEVKENVLADRPGPPALSIHCDESSQGARFVVVGGP
jgi:hypothetical protein